MVEVAVRKGASQETRRCRAPEQKNVTRICLLEELLFANVVKFPHFLDVHGYILLAIALLDVPFNLIKPIFGFFF